MYSTASTPSSIAPTAGLLITVADPEGRRLNLTYNSVGYVSHITLPDGGQLIYSYDSDVGNLLSVQYPDGGIRQYNYNESSYTSGENFPSAMTGLIDETNTRYESTTYNSSEQATSSYFAGNVGNTQIAYNSNGTASITYPLGLTSTMTFSTVQSVNRVSAISGPCGPQCNQPFKSITHDSNGNPQTSVDFNGNTTATTYNSSNLLATEVGAQGTSAQRTTNLTWNITLRVPLTRTVANASGTIISSAQWVYNTTGQTLAYCAIDPTNSADSGYNCSNTGAVPVGVRRTTYTYCTIVGGNCPLPGLLLSVTGPRTDLTQATSYSYYTAASTTNCGTPGAACYQPGDLYQVTDALGHVTTIASYDADGRITRITDPNGVNTDLTYYPRGWLKTRAVSGAQTSFTYTAYGAVQTITDPDGVTTTFGYDTAHRLTQITDALGNTIKYTLDAAGDKTGESVYDSTGTLHKSLTRTFNTLGQLTTVVDGLNNTVFNASASTSYDANGNLIQSSDGLGFKRQLGYDALNRLQQTIDNYNGTDTATKNTTTGYTYDSLDRLTQVTDPSNLSTTYAYDGLSDATGQTSPDTGSTSRTFDAAGNVLTRTDAKGITATNTYDGLDRLITTSYADTTQNVTYSYDDPNGVTGCSTSNPVGRLTRIIEATVTTVFCYDPRGNVIQKQQITTSNTDTMGYSITNGGRLSGIVYPDGTLASYTRDGDGRIQSISVTPPSGTASTVVSGVTYQPFGPVSGYTLGNEQAVARAYDANYRLTDLTSPAFNLHVARDAMGDVIAIGNGPGANPATETYAYDPLYRLLSVTEASGSVLESVTYNPTGDRLTKAGSGLATGAYTYNTGTHQLNATGNAARTVDADGNTTAISEAGSTYGFGYSDRNRMTVAQVGGSTIASYTYNALNERIRKVTGTATERYDYNEASQMLGEYGATNRDYIWMDGIPVANVDTTGTTSTIAYVTADQLGTPRAVATSSGTTEWQNAYQGNPWNEIAPTSTGYTYNLGFPGQYLDAETGLSYNVNRDYDSATGRYIQSDPIGLRGGVSTFTYVTGNPLSYRDPTGLYLTSVDAFCAQAMDFCLELWGDISHSEGTIQHKLGNDCAAEAAEAAGDLFHTAAKVSKYASLAKGLTKVGIAATGETSWGAAWDAAKDNGWDQLSDWAKDQPIDQAKENALGILGKSLVPGTSFGQALQDQLDEDLEPYKSAAEAVRSALGGRESNETDAPKER
jgi:RHS repeat-associated protein